MSRRILVIDDEPQIRKILRISLGANGYEVIEAENAAKGIELFRAQPPDLLILDLGLPDMDGQEVITTVREVSDLPIIVLSVRAQEFDKVEALDRGANDYVVKPFGVAELIARVRAVLRPRVSKDQDAVVEAGPVRIDLEVDLTADELRLRVVNSTGRADGSDSPGQGIGLRNVRERLTVQFGTRASLRSGPEGQDWVSEIRLPVLREWQPPPSRTIAPI